MELFALMYVVTSLALFVELSSLMYELQPLIALEFISCAYGKQAEFLWLMLLYDFVPQK